MAITLTYSLSEDGFREAARELWAHSAIGNRGNWVVVGISAGIGSILLASGFWTGWIWLFAAVMFVALTLLREGLWRSSYRKMSKYKAPITVTFTSDAIKTETREGESTLPWTVFFKYTETENYFFLHLGKRGLSILPKSSAQTPEDLLELREKIATNLPAARKRWL